MLRQPPLISRIRHRLAAMVWLCALLVLSKGAFATSCLTDGVDAAQSPVAQASQMATDEVAVAPQQHGDDSGGPCWHAGSGGCHCMCSHNAALPLAGWLLVQSNRTESRAPTTSLPLLSLESSRALRPPIS